MARKPFSTPDEKLAVVLSAPEGETTQIEVARRLKMSQTTIAQMADAVSRGWPECHRLR